MVQLRILSCNPDGGAYHHILNGIADAFRALGHQFQRWNGTDSALRQYQPHIYLGCSGWRQVFPKWARDQYGTKIMIHANPYGSIRLKAMPGEPDINEPQEAINWVISQNPDAIYCYGNGHDISTMWNKWTDNHGIPVIPLPTGGNAVLHKPVLPDPAFKCDVGFVGGYWPYKAMNIDKYVLPAINKFDAKVFGWGGWRHPKYKGVITDENINKLFSSARVCPTVVEPHTTRYGIDIPERIWKIPLGGGFVVCDPCAGLTNYVDPAVFPIARDPANYIELIDHYLKHESERTLLANKQRKAILANHTYFTRIQGILIRAGYHEEVTAAQKMVEAISLI